jgi:hypothetical protein
MRELTVSINLAIQPKKLGESSLIRSDFKTFFNVDTI